MKVFRYGPKDPGFDENRFDWEVRIAREVSGLPHLPEVLAAGITPVSGPSVPRVDALRRGHPPRSRAPGRSDDGGRVRRDRRRHRRRPRGDAPARRDPLRREAGERLRQRRRVGARRPRFGVAADLAGPRPASPRPMRRPEVWRGSSPTPEADVYSLALTMLYARTGQVPIAGNPPTPDDIVARSPTCRSCCGRSTPTPAAGPAASPTSAGPFDRASSPVSPAGGSSRSAWPHPPPSRPTPRRDRARRGPRRRREDDRTAAGTGPAVVVSLVPSFRPIVLCRRSTGGCRPPDPGNPQRRPSPQHQEHHGP